MSTQTDVFEVNFDGLVGPSHHYAGLSKGNIASQSNAMAIANPKAAALQGLKKMLSLHERGFKQGVLIPHLRPNFEILYAIGLIDKDPIKHPEQLTKAWSLAPEIVSKCFSASPMWTANAATMSPWSDCLDGKSHFTAANLCRMFHRSYESPFTSRLLQGIFSDERYFSHHTPLPSGHFFGDEGAANHTRLADSHGAAGVELFVYGEQVFNPDAPRPQVYPARQSLEASQAVARLHKLKPEQTVFAQQNPDLIDAGVFHNDVIAVGCTSLLFFHEQAFLNTDDVLADIKAKYTGQHFHPLMVKDSEVSVSDAVNTYLFNSQLIDCSENATDKQFILVAPSQCKENQAVSKYLDSLVESASPIKEVLYFNLNESMKNGGGPACLRLRVVLSQQQIDSIKPKVMLNQRLYDDLLNWVNTHYREHLTFDDLQDPLLIGEMLDAARALEKIVELEGIYQI